MLQYSCFSKKAGAQNTKARKGSGLMTEETKAKRQEPLERGTEEDCPQRALESLSTYEMGAVLSFPKVTERGAVSRTHIH